MRIKFWICLACLLITVSIFSMITIFTITLKLPNNNEDKNPPEIKRFRGSNNEIPKENNNEQIPQINTLPPTTSPVLNTNWLINGFEENLESHYTNLKTAMVLVCYNRPQYLTRAFKSVKSLYESSYPPVKPDFYVSQDADVDSVTTVISNFKEEMKSITNVNHLKHKQYIGKNGYQSLSQHYKWIFQQIFDEYNYDQIILIEDDMEFSSDFLEYFMGLSPILAKDKTAWNDIGQKQFVNNNKVLYRTDFFPGLGWLTTKDVYEEVKNDWPIAYWDDWFRSPEIRKGRSCLYPEVPRSYTFGREGTSVGQFFNKFLEPIKLNDVSVMWSKVDYKPLIKENYDLVVDKVINNAVQINIGNLRGEGDYSKVYKTFYSDFKDYHRIGRSIGIMDDIKFDVPRSSYNGVVHIKYNGKLLFICPTK